MRSEFEKDLATLINKHGLEKDFGNVPDIYLASFVVNALNELGQLIRDRDAFWDIDVRRDTNIE